jgi:hypothetical protein
MDGRQYVRDWGGGLVPMIGRLRKAKVEIDEMGCIESSGRGSIGFYAYSFRLSAVGSYEGRHRMPYLYLRF